jgi:hypothetical protein
MHLCFVTDLRTVNISYTTLTVWFLNPDGLYLIILTKSEEALEITAKLQLRLEIMFFITPTSMNSQLTSLHTFLLYQSPLPSKRKKAKKTGQNLAFTVPICMKPITIDEHHVKSAYKNSI